MTNAGVMLEARGLTKTYRRGPEQVHALEDASFSLRLGEVVALLGPSGSGKTTLLNILAGWERPDSGQVVWSGEAASRTGQAIPWSELAIVSQTPGLVAELSVKENVELPVRLGSLASSEPVERLAELLESLGLVQVADRLPEEVSLGEQQRAALARALIASPRLLLADEPTGHQDELWTAGVFRVLRRARAEGMTCLVATHNLEILKYVDRSLHIRDGKVEDVLGAPETAQSEGS